MIALMSTVSYAQQAPSSDNANNKLASERAERNSVTGDRNPTNGGNFGQDQSSYVHSLDQPYGSWLNDGGWTGSSTAPNPPSQ